MVADLYRYRGGVIFPSRERRHDLRRCPGSGLLRPVHLQDGEPLLRVHHRCPALHQLDPAEILTGLRILDRVARGEDQVSLASLDSVVGPPIENRPPVIEDLGNPTG